MIIVLNYNKQMQNKMKEFILRNIRNELSITNKKIFNEITKDLENIYENYIKNGGEMLYAYDIDQNKIVGTIGMKIENNIAILKRFYVDRKYRNQKVGYLLYLELEKKIFEKELKEIYLTSGKELENAHKFYKRNGWILENNNPGIFVREGAFLYKKQYFNELQYDCM